MSKNKGTTHVYNSFFNPFARGYFAEKCVLKLVDWFSCHCRAIKSSNLPESHLQVIQFATLMQNISLQSSCMCRKQNFEIVFEFKSCTVVLTFTFCFLSSSPFSLFLPHFFFCSYWGKVFKKAFRILGLDERKGRWVVEQDFHGNFQVNVTCFFAFFSGVLDWIVLILVWFERSLHSAQVSGQSYPWKSKLMMSQAVERTLFIYLFMYLALPN